MKRITFLAVVVTAAAVVAFVGCSDDTILSPAGGPGSSGGSTNLAYSEVGPSHVAMCIDVSDSMSADELAALVDALRMTLLKPGIVPWNGSVSVSAFVYGDTVATLLEPTPVNDVTVTDSIVPALQGLLTDRIVGGAGFDLPGALEAARQAVMAASVPDRHVLIAGSGMAERPDSALAIAGELGAAGIMVSAIGIGPSGSNLEEFALAAGGFYGLAVDDLPAVVDEAFLYMLHVDVDAEPEHAELSRGEDHTVTARVYRAFDPETYPVEGVEVTFLVTAGPNAAETATAPTGADGAAAFTLNGDGGPGVDTIFVSALHPGTGTTMADTVSVTWINAPPVCDAGGPYTVEVTADTATVVLDATGSSDADGDTLSFLWSADCEAVSIDDPASPAPMLMITEDCLCVDSFAVEVMVTDGYDTTTCASTVLIDDLRPPIVIVREEPLVMWPPNHKRIEVAPEMLLEWAEDACGNPIDLATADVVEVRSDEPEDGRGDGKFMNDIVIHCPNLVKLRAERMGGGDGRVYTVVYRITNENGIWTDVEATAIVPHDASGMDAGLDGFGGYTVVADCDGRR